MKIEPVKNIRSKYAVIQGSLTWNGAGCFFMSFILLDIVPLMIIQALNAAKGVNTNENAVQADVTKAISALEVT